MTIFDNAINNPDIKQYVRDAKDIINRTLDDKINKLVKMWQKHLTIVEYTDAIKYISFTLCLIQIH